MSKTTQDGADVVEQLRLKSSILNSDGLIAKAAAELSRLRTENERLREALQEIVGFTAAVEDDDPMSHVHVVARAALSKALGEGMEDNG